MRSYNVYSSSRGTHHPRSNQFSLVPRLEMLFLPLRVSLAIHQDNFYVFIKAVFMDSIRNSTVWLICLMAFVHSDIASSNCDYSRNLSKRTLVGCAYCGRQTKEIRRFAIKPSGAC